MMDYRDALSYLKSLKLYCNDMYEKDPDEVWKDDCEALNVAISAMQELQLYKDTGLTPDQLREIDKLYSEQAKELGEYKKLGTLEEVREAVEKQKRKKPCTSNRCYVCPHCGLVTSLKTKHNYCDACGQRISWEEL